MPQGKFERRRIYRVEDLRLRAKRWLPGFVFDFVEGAAGDESAAERNVAALAERRVTPRFGGNASASMERTIFGRTYGTPFGIAPIGLAELVFPKADLLLAQAAAAANIPYICSAASGSSVEDVVRASGRAPWFQLYCPREPTVTQGIIDRLVKLGVEVLVITVDVPVPGRRLRDLRNGLSLPPRPSRRLAWDCMKSPAWTLLRLAAGRIGFPNFEPHMGRMALPFRDLMALQTGGRLDWEWLAQLRSRWPGKLVIKGVMCREDAAAMQQIGADGIIVSNHGGRQFEAAPAAFDCLAAVADSMPNCCVMFDSGVRTGSDVVRSSLEGAEMTWIGRPFLYALAAIGKDGPGELIRMLRAETREGLALAGPRAIRRTP